MPTYVYRCQSCGTRFEAWQKITEEPLTVCPTCSGEVHRVLFAPALAFKGSGFYSTDNGQGAVRASTDTPEKSKKADKPEKSEKAATTSSDTSSSPATSKTPSPSASASAAS